MERHVVQYKDIEVPGAA